MTSAQPEIRRARLPLADHRTPNPNASASTPLANKSETTSGREGASMANNSLIVWLVEL
jgi:hypothetical protein